MFGLVEPEGLKTLEAMGFGREAARAALAANKGDVAAAAQALSQPSVEDRCRTLAASRQRPGGRSGGTASCGGSPTPAQAGGANQPSGPAPQPPRGRKRQVPSS